MSKTTKTLIGICAGLLVVLVALGAFFFLGMNKQEVPETAPTTEAVTEATTEATTEAPLPETSEELLPVEEEEPASKGWIGLVIMASVALMLVLGGVVFGSKKRRHGKFSKR